MNTAVEKFITEREMSLADMTLREILIRFWEDLTAKELLESIKEDMGNLPPKEPEELVSYRWADSAESLEHDGQSFVLLPPEFNSKVSDVTVGGWMFKKEKASTNEIWYGPSRSSISLPASIEVTCKNGAYLVTTAPKP